MIGKDADVVIVVPTYRERENLPILVRELVKHDRYNVMVVDDDSPDGTGDVADELAMTFPGRVDVIHREGQRGLGRSYAEGFARAVKTSANVICQMDADLSHDPTQLAALIAETRNFDLVIGSRYIQGGRIVDWPRRRVLLSSVANKYVRFVTNLTVRDCTSGFRAWRRSALARMSLQRIQSEGYSFQVEMLYAASALGLRIGEHPITFVERRYGTSKLSVRVFFESVAIPWMLRAKIERKRSPPML
jgi:dolichol-phosphate mannosyltransferase